MIEPEMYAFTCRKLAIVTVGRSLDDLPLWMVRQTIAVETEGRTTRILIDPTDEPRWDTNPAITIDGFRRDDERIPFRFGSGRGNISVHADPTQDQFVIVGKPGSFGPRFGGTL